jgi:hypothetical protein
MPTFVVSIGVFAATTIPTLVSVNLQRFKTFGAASKKLKVFALPSPAPDTVDRPVAGQPDG